MDITLVIIALIAGIIGLLGVIIPVLPGTLLSYAGIICIYFTDGKPITTVQLIICGIVSVVAVVLDYLLPGYFTKLFGGTKAGITGATVGTFIGCFLGIPGIILGPFVGALVGELIGSKSNFSHALKVGFGSFLSFLFSSGIKLFAGIYMLYYIIKAFIDILF